MLTEATMQKDTVHIEKGLINLGILRGLEDDFESAYDFFSEAARSVEARKDSAQLIDLKINLSSVQEHRGFYDNALGLLDEANALAVELSDMLSRAEIEFSRARVYQLSGQYEKAFNHLDTYRLLHDSILNEERVRAVTEMQEKYEAEKKKREIQDLQVKNLDSELKNERIARGRNRLYAGAIGLLLLMFFLGNQYRIIRRSRNQLHMKNIVIEKEQKRSDDLLKHILPDEVAEELKSKGEAVARDYDMVSIMFTDFKEFTQASEKMSAAELVAELNVCFKAFDAICETHGIEKFKTIGDGYMAAGGIPVPDQRAAHNTVMAGLDMVQFMTERKVQRAAEGRIGFEVRVGIDTGSVVAGIVGTKKFQYDVWGDTVNTASRMESHGVVGKVNISQHTYELIKDDPAFEFEPRGKVMAKGKGEVDMYFVKQVAAVMA
jgi:class 3 adenylate cyclase